MSRPPVALGLYTELLRHGGVQRLGRHQALAQCRWAKARGLEPVILSLNDPAEAEPLRVDGEIVPVRGFGKSKAAFLAEATRLALSRKVALVYANHINLAPVARALRALPGGKRPYAVHAHGIEVWEPLSTAGRLGLAGAAFATTTSDDTGAHIRRVQRMADLPLETLYPPLDPDFLAEADAPPKPVEHATEVRAALDAARQGPLFLTVSRLDSTEQRKGIDTAIRAYAGIAKDFPSATYAIIGQGADRERLESIAREGGVAERVRFLGRQPDEALATLYRECAVFVLPSAKEGLGIVFLEAMVHRKPCIGGNAGGTPEVVRDGETGFLVDSQDVEALTARMRTLLEDGALRERLGNSGRARMEDIFTYRRFEERFFALLDRLRGGV